MYKMDEDLKDDYTSCDYFSNFIKKSIKDLRVDGICYVFHKYQVKEILKYIKTEVVVKNNDCGFTLNIPRKYRKEVYYE